MVLTLKSEISQTPDISVIPHIRFFPIIIDNILLGFNTKEASSSLHPSIF